MFLTTSTGTVINVNYIEAIVPLDKTQVKRVAGIFTLAELADFGFKTGRKDVFVHTDYESARKEVAESPDTRILRFLPNGVIGYMELQSGESGLIDEFNTIEDNILHTHRDELYFLPKSQYNEIMAYSVLMHCGKEFIIRVSDYEVLSRMLAAARQ